MKRMSFSWAGVARNNLLLSPMMDSTGEFKETGWQEEAL